jgi:tetratricopeptide (TPR) repeat protein
MDFRRLRRLICSAWIITCVLCSSVAATPQEAWQALHNLDIVKAKPLFEQELKKSPKDVTLMRGLLLAAYFDMDHETQAKMIKSMIAADPTNIYLMPVFEHVAADMTDWGDHFDLQYAIGEALVKNASPQLALVGRHMMASCFSATPAKHPSGWDAEMSCAPGFWVCGPFDDQSEIAAYRTVPSEGGPLDTSAEVIGKNGARCGWTYLDNVLSHDIFPGMAIENSEDMASLARTFFELPEDMEMLVLMGGAYHGRVLLDGTKVHDDPVYRNASEREGFRIKLRKGSHEIAVVVGGPEQATVFSVSIFGADYKPIKGFRWLRYASVKNDPSVSAIKMHPIFDQFDSAVATSSLPDSRFWKGVLRIYNGYARETVSEFEELYRQGSLSPLETWILYKALELNDEKPRAVEYLSRIKEKAAGPLVDLSWALDTIDDFEARLGACEELQKKYPDRYPIELLTAMRPVLSRDAKAILANLQALQTKYPRAVGTHQLMSSVYTNVVNDPESAYREFKAECDVSGQKNTYVMQAPYYLVAMGKFPEAIKAAREALASYAPTDGVLTILIDAYTKSHHDAELIPLFDSLRQRYPYNIEIHSALNKLYSTAGKYDEAREMLLEIHSLKPSAIAPYTDIDSLHNNIPYDSIFGTIDVMSLWDVEPSEAELAGSKTWSLLDRRQKLVFETGVVFNDIHTATVVLDKSAVESMQETRLPFNPKDSFTRLLVARRLRKGQPPLSGALNGQSVVFKDLQPGDAVELHYRFWSGNSGDLWHEFWNTYQVHASFYQRYWEYSVLSNRKDLNYRSAPPAPKPEIGDFCGYTKYTWKGEKYAGWRLDLSMLPPQADMCGQIWLSTMADWQVLGDWYQSVTDAILGENPRSNQLSDSLAAGLSSDRDKLAAFYRYIVLEIPYQTIQFNYHASMPHKPDDVLLNKWGDCKDKGMLLVQMLRHSGIQSWPVLVMTRNNGTAIPQPQFEFDHLIVSCVINDDTIFVDPTEIPFPATRSISHSTAAQPYLLIGAGRLGILGKLPDLKPEDSHWKAKLTLTPGQNGPMSFTYSRDFFNQEAGYIRERVRQYAASEYKKNLESSFSSEWGVSLSLDSLLHDSVQSTDTAFNELWYGTINLSVQKVGTTTIITPPTWSVVPKDVLPLLAVDGKRDFPVDLRDYVGRYEKVMEISVPAEYGKPKLPAPAHVKDSLFSLTYRPSWDDKNRKLTLSYDVRFFDGQCSLASFTKFAGQVIDVFESPLLFEKP